MAGTLTVADIAARTSSTIDGQAGILAEEAMLGFEDGALFDETAAAYTRIRLKAEGLMADLLSNNIRQSLNAYTRIKSWSTLAPIPSQGTDAQSTTSAELDTLLQNLRTLLSSLGKAVGTVPLRKVTKSMLQHVENIILNQVILYHQFSGAGALHLKNDVEAISSVLIKYLDKGSVDLSLGRLHQATELLNIPIRSKHQQKDAGETDTHEEKSNDVETIGLFEAGKRLFEGSGDDAKEFLDQLGLDRLSIGEARKILSRRIELGS